MAIKVTSKRLLSVATLLLVFGVIYLLSPGYYLQTPKAGPWNQTTDGLSAGVETDFRSIENKTGLSARGGNGLKFIYIWPHIKFLPVYPLDACVPSLTQVD